MRLVETIHKFVNTYELWVYDTAQMEFIYYIVINGIITSVKTSPPEIAKEFPHFVNVIGITLEELNHLLETHHLITGNL
jgi:hypothetical protein